MREFYSQFGELTDIIVMRDPNTKRSRGFGFVTFATKANVDAAMAARPHVIDGKTVDPKRAVPRDDKNRNESNVSTKRLYVSGVREDHTEDMFTEYFGKFGNVVKSEIILDKVTNKPRGFGFVTFDDYDPVDQCVLLRSHMINGFRCDVKKGLSKDEMNKVQAQSNRDRMDRLGRSRGDVRGGHGGPGAGWGSQQGGAGRGGWGQQGGYGYGGPQGGGYGQQGGYGGYGAQQGWGEQAGWGQQSGGGWEDRVVAGVSSQEDGELVSHPDNSSGLTLKVAADTDLISFDNSVLFMYVLCYYTVLSDLFCYFLFSLLIRMRELVQCAVSFVGLALANGFLYVLVMNVLRLSHPYLRSCTTVVF
ncbi:hypothetical protein KIN20_005596 [Parelaphostrongylus tenuis]|uniref:RRM domain-containing protein n=1 Tax=Parelaphostrongylus tenuis TaxID=148309 RepID=A0AAD5M0L9_PARTN|nr:hypothetical protein KIN20_005596 [Parelaphostrongylus tenuis]